MNLNPVKANVTSFDLSKAMTFSKIFSKIKLSPSARLVLRCLVDFWNPAKGLVYPGQSMIADCTGVRRETVNKAIDELRKLGLILTTGEAGERLKYYFTAKFFELLNISHSSDKNTQTPCEKSSQHEQHEAKQINNKNHFKNKFKPYSKLVNEVKYKSASQTIQTIESDKNQACSPLDFNKNEQIEYYNSLPAFLRTNSLFAREIKKRWGL